MAATTSLFGQVQNNLDTASIQLDQAYHATADSTPMV